MATLLPLCAGDTCLLGAVNDRSRLGDDLDCVNFASVGDVSTNSSSFLLLLFLFSPSRIRAVTAITVLGASAAVLPAASDSASPIPLCLNRTCRNHRSR